MRPSLLIAAAVALCVAGAAAPSSANDLYPTDRCVADKLSAAANACRSLFDAQAFEGLVPRPAVASKRIADAKAALESAWSEAETTSADAGVDCAQTTATADEVFEEIQDGVTGITAQVQSAVAGSRFVRAHPRLRRSPRLRPRAAGSCCRRRASISSSEARTATARASVSCASSEACGWSSCCAGRPSARNGAAEVADSVKGLVQRVAVANLVSPNVPTDFQMYEPAAQVPYQGKMLEPICSRGTPWVYFARRGTVNKLLVYYQGGGACWDLLHLPGAAGLQAERRPRGQPGQREQRLRRPQQPRQSLPRLERGLRALLHRRRPLGRSHGAARLAAASRPDGAAHPAGHDPAQGVRERAGGGEVRARALRQPGAGLRHRARAPAPTAPSSTASTCRRASIPRPTSRRWAMRATAWCRRTSSRTRSPSGASRRTCRRGSRPSTSP